MDVLGAKLLTGSLFFLIAVCFIFLPFWAIRRYVPKRRTNVPHHSAGQQILLVQCLYSLASGVLIGTCLIHLLPESLETFQEAVRSRDPHNASQSARLDTVNLTDNVSSEEHAQTEQYPWAELLVALGFIAVYMLDNGIKSCSRDDKVPNHKDSEIEDEDVRFLPVDESSCTQNTAAGDDDVCHAGRESYQKHDHAGRESYQKHGHAGISRLQHMLQAVTLNMSHSTAPYAPVGQTEEDTGEDSIPAILDSDITESNSLDTRLHNGPLDSLPGVTISQTDCSVFTASSQRTVHKARTLSTSNKLRSAALVAALCLHGFFDGIIVGLQTSASVVLSLAFAISLHKSFVCVGLSLSLLRMDDKHSSTMSVCLSGLLFAMASPLGVLVSGVFLQEVFEETGNGGASMTPACLQTFAVGTFMYVAVLEVLERQQARTLRVEILNQLFLCLGFGFMAGLRAAVGDP